MHLTLQEVEQFYNIWFPLLHYVNQRRKLVPTFPQKWKDAGVSPEVAVPLRNALWEDDALREAFIAENPVKLPKSDLAIVQSWQHRVSGDFFIFRHLKRYSIFLSSDTPSRGYGVHGITGDLEEIIGNYLPIYVHAVLIPFGDRIIYDSLLSSYPVLFGSGIRHDLEATYRAIQERGVIITKLPFGGSASSLETIRASNKKVIAAFQKSLSMSGLSPKMVLEHSSNLADFEDYLLSKATPPTLILDLTANDMDSYRKSREKINLVSFKRFIWFLRDTWRMDWDEAERLLNYIKGK